MSTVEDYRQLLQEAEQTTTGLLASVARGLRTNPSPDSLNRAINIAGMDMLMRTIADSSEAGPPSDNEEYESLQMAEGGEFRFMPRRYGFGKELDLIKKYKITEDTAMPVEFGNATEWKWNSSKIPTNGVNFSKENGGQATIHSRTTSGMVALRSSSPLNNLRCYWEVEVKFKTTTSELMFGVCADDFPVKFRTFNQAARSKQFCSWILSQNGLVYHAAKPTVYTTPFKLGREFTMGFLFDSSAGTLSYYKNGEYLGVAFNNMREPSGLPLFPMICSSNSARVRLTLKNVRTELPTMKERCRDILIRVLESPKDGSGNVRLIVLPTPLRDYVVASIVQEQKFKDKKSGLFYLG